MPYEYDPHLLPPKAHDIAAHVQFCVMDSHHEGAQFIDWNKHWEVASPLVTKDLSEPSFVLTLINEHSRQRRHYTVKVVPVTEVSVADLMAEGIERSVRRSLTPEQRRMVSEQERVVYDDEG